MTSPQHLYRYSAVVTDVYDGDTLTVDIDLGFGVILTRQKIRLARADTPELRGGDAESKAAARVARDRVVDLVRGQGVLLHTMKDKGKYGRWVADVTLPDGRDLAVVLLSEGLAREYAD